VPIGDVIGAVAGMAVLALVLPGGLSASGWLVLLLRVSSVAFTISERSADGSHLCGEQEQNVRLNPLARRDPVARTPVGSRALQRDGDDLTPQVGISVTCVALDNRG
jgi:hypothetical protein